MRSTLFYSFNNITKNDTKAICCERNAAFIQKRLLNHPLPKGVAYFFSFFSILAREEGDVGGHLQDIKSFRSFQLVPCTDKTLLQLARKQDKREKGKNL